MLNPNFGSVIPTGKFEGHLWEQIDLPRYVKANNISSLVNLSNSAPIALNNNIVTVHDLSYMINPKWFSLGYRTFYRFLTPIIIKKAKTY